MEVGAGETGPAREQPGDYVKGPSRKTTQSPRAHVNAHLRTSVLHGFDYSHDREQVKFLGLYYAIPGTAPKPQAKMERGVPRLSG